MREVDLFDGVFVLEVDLDTLNRRIDERVALDPTDWVQNQRNGNSLRDCIKRKKCASGVQKLPGYGRWIDRAI
jgi:hypothetical protein